MISQNLSRILPVTVLCVVSVFLTAAAPILNALQVQDPIAKTPLAARKAIDKAYEAWARARVAHDEKTLDSIMDPDFYVLLDGRKISREKFLNDITQVRNNVRLTRFDPDILTVQRTGDFWTAVITEKLEIEITGADGKAQTLCSFWVTRDGWRQKEGKWLVTFSEAIGHEDWIPGTKPPIEGW